MGFLVLHSGFHTTTPNPQNPKPPSSTVRGFVVLHPRFRTANPDPQKHEPLRAHSSRFRGSAFAVLDREWRYPKPRTACLNCSWFRYVAFVVLHRQFLKPQTPCCSVPTLCATVVTGRMVIRDDERTRTVVNHRCIGVV